MEDHPKEQHRRSELKHFRRALRKNLTPAEVALWKLLKNKKLAGRKFRRQHQAGPYILDFYGPAEKLAIELDGEVHRNLPRWEYDEDRTGSLQEQGIRVIRIENREVFENPEGVLYAIALHFKDGEEGNEIPPDSS